MRIVITVKRDASPQIVLNKLYTFTQMQTTFGVIMLAIVNGEPKTLTLREILQNYIDFQEDVVTRRTRFELKKAEGPRTYPGRPPGCCRFHRRSGFDHPYIKDRSQARQRMTERFGLDDVQTQAIVQMQLGALTGLDRQKLEDELGALHMKLPI